MKDRRTVAYKLILPRQGLAIKQALPRVSTKILWIASIFIGILITGKYITAQFAAIKLQPIIPIIPIIPNYGLVRYFVVLLFNTSVYSHI